MTPPAGSSLSPFTYTPANPEQVPVSSTLADVAMYYWSTTFRGDMANKIVPPSKIPPLAASGQLLRWSGVYGTIPKRRSNRLSVRLTRPADDAADD